MKLTLRKTAATAGAVTAGVIATLSLVSACGSGTPQYDDLQNVPPSYPNYAATFLNVDGFPNITMLCIDGQGFATTTRDDSNAAMEPISAWNGFCAKQIGKRATQDGQP